MQKESAAPQTITVEVSPGELIDKITILEIKTRKISDAQKLRHVRDELDVLSAAFQSRVPVTDELSRLQADLTDVNERLWDIEDEIRLCERDQEFGDRFIELARSVYKTNDIRASIKRKINELLGSRLVEEKSYEEY